LNNELLPHVMVLDNIHCADTEEWYCPTCGRRILMKWPPNYKKVILDAGDDEVIHCVGRGGLPFGASQVSQNRESLSEDIQRLIQWDVWLEQIGFESWWDRDS